MKSTKPITANIQDIYRSVQQRSEESSQIIRDFLQNTGKDKITQTSAIRPVHDVLLFILGHAADDLEFQLAAEAWERFNMQLRKIPVDMKKELLNSGYQHTIIEGLFSFELTRWLFEAFPDNTSASAAIAKYDADALLMLFYPGILKNEMTNAPVNGLRELLHAFHGRQSGAMHLLLKELDAAPWPGALKEKIFGMFEVYLKFSIGDTTNPMQWRALFPEKRFYHPHGIEKKIEFRETLKHAKFTLVHQSKAEKSALSTYARLVLLSLFRETDPITYSSDKEIQFYSTGRGMSIAFFFSTPEFRLTSESYVGYMAFKNNIPLAYGGAWICGDNGRIGVNIFPWFRGGESAWVFTQLIACYHKQLGVQQFSVEPYQIGLDNPDGIASGAFWFYYKLGFRPVQPELAEMAASEWEKITNQKGYRSPVEILKKLAHSILKIQLGSKPAGDADSPAIRKAVAEIVINTFHGDYREAAAKCASAAAHALDIKISAIPHNARKLFEEYALLLAGFPDLKSWTSEDKKLVVKMIIEKAGGDEVEFITAWQKNKSFQKALNRLLKQ